MSMQNISINLYQREVDPTIDKEKQVPIGNSWSAKTVGQAVELLVDELGLVDNNKFEMEMWSRWPVKIGYKYYGMRIEVDYSQGSKD